MLAVELSTVYENHFALWHDLRKSDVCTNLKIFETYRKYRHVRIITKIYSETVFFNCNKAVAFTSRVTTYSIKVVSSEMCQKDII